MPPRPARTSLLRASAFQAEWERRPPGEVAVGIRCLSHEETMTCGAEAAKEAVANGRTGEEAVRRYNEALMAWALGYACCDPNNATLPYFDSGDASVRAALTPEAVAFLFGELELAHAAESPTRPEADDADLADLAVLLMTPEDWSHLPGPKARRVRRWLRYVLDEIRGEALLAEAAE
jgi:hypothetical protein